MILSLIPLALCTLMVKYNTKVKICIHTFFFVSFVNAMFYKQKYRKKKMSKAILKIKKKTRVRNASYYISINLNLYISYDVCVVNLLPTLNVIFHKNIKSHFFYIFILPLKLWVISNYIYIYDNNLVLV